MYIGGGNIIHSTDDGKISGVVQETLDEALKRYEGKWKLVGLGRVIAAGPCSPALTPEAIQAATDQQANQPPPENTSLLKAPNFDLQWVLELMDKIRGFFGSQ